MNSLQQERDAAAEAVWMSYEFGCPVTDADGWAYTSPGREMTRAIYLEPEQCDDFPNPVLRGHFTVTFAADDSARVIEAYAMLNGNLIGTGPA